MFCNQFITSDSAARNPILSSILFDFLFLNGLVDEFTGNVFIWRSSAAKPVKIYVELPSRSPMTELRVCQLLQSVVITVNESYFVSTFDQLKIGMGEDDFFSERCDGTICEGFM